MGLGGDGEGMQVASWMERGGEMNKKSTAVKELGETREGGRTLALGRPSQPASAVRPQDAVVGECDQSKMAARPPCHPDRLSLRIWLGVEPQERAARRRRQRGNVPSNKISEKL